LELPTFILNAFVMRDEIAATGFRCLTKMRRIRVVLSFERVASQNGSHLSRCETFNPGRKLKI